MEKSEIQDFYKDTNVFITGGTGFVGKILIEKLLRDTEVTTIYILIRDKKGRNAHSRIDDLFDDVVFSRLKAQQVKVKNRVEAIPGDVSFGGLGLSITDRQKLASKINVVFHVAATVNFNEPIKDSYNINVGASMEVMKLAREIQNLKACIHVSTAFSNCQRKIIEEKIYDHPYANVDLGSLLEKLSNEEANKYTESILGEWPNTYTFTKALAESLVKKYSTGLPVAIYRPSIVISTYKEPIPGWIDNIYGPTGVTVGILSGVLRVSYADGNAVSDVVPVDTCVAGMIASAWDVARRENEKNEENGNKDEIPVYNFVSSVENPLKYAEMFKININYAQMYPFSKALWTPAFLFPNSYYQFRILTVLLHYIPAVFMDMFAVLIGRKPRLLRTYFKIHKFLDVIQYFSVREWDFSNKNVQNMWRKMNNLDRELFPLSMSQVSWFLMFRTYVSGVRRYLMKDPDSTIEAAKKRNFSLNQKVFLRMAKQIVQLFPNENLHVYMIPSELGGPKGKLWHRYRNIKKIIFTINLAKQPKARKSDEGSSVDETEVQDSEAHLDFLKVATEPWTKVINSWEETFKVRKRLFANDRIEMFKNYPSLLQNTGVELLEIDFNLRYPEQIDAIYGNWKLVRTACLTELKERKIQIMDKADVDEDIQLILGLIYLFPPVIVSKNRKNIWRPTKTEISDGFFLVIDDIEQLDGRLEQRKEKLKTYNKTLEPFGVICGDITHPQFYVHVIKKIYPVESCVRAVELLYKCFFALNREYPAESEHVWLAIQELMFGVKPPKKHAASASVDPIKSYTTPEGRCE